ncbi:Acetylornithine/succinyldiaminopimelate aminotransferase [Eubacterium plexicaudatum ASF492]|nr:Acetylornithine/succinyldiaminopimelate aminotransferase [Eubacterium plexicaudatum ASF492]
MNETDYKNEAEQMLLHTYNRFPVVFDHADGVYLYDIEGKKYLDFTSGIGVMALGYRNTEYNEALKTQIDKLMHTSNLYYNVPIIEAAKKVRKASQMDRVFFTNSGAEAVEGAIKAAKNMHIQETDMQGMRLLRCVSRFTGARSVRCR